MLHGLAVSRDCIDIILYTLNLTKIIILKMGEQEGEKCMVVMVVVIVKESSYFIMERQ